MTWTVKIDDSFVEWTYRLKGATNLSIKRLLTNLMMGTDLVQVGEPELTRQGDSTMTEIQAIKKAGEQKGIFEAISTLLWQGRCAFEEAGKNDGKNPLSHLDIQIRNIKEIIRKVEELRVYWEG